MVNDMRIQLDDQHLVLILKLGTYDVAASVITDRQNEQHTERLTVILQHMR